MFRTCFREGDEKRAKCGIARCMPLPGRVFSGAFCERVVKGSGLSGKKAAKVSCEDCFFKRNGLCALTCDAPCPTFRPDHPDGLRPPQQMRFVFRQERRRQAAWAFPSAQEQAMLHR